MSRRIAFSLAAMVLGLGALAFSASDQGHAARDFGTIVADSARDELVVYESAASIYCQIFRRDVLPVYERSTRAGKVPMRFVDVNSANIEAPELMSPITSVPTVVYMRDGREEGRITGYVGPESFQKLVSHLIGGTE